MDSSVKTSYNKGKDINKRNSVFVIRRENINLASETSSTGKKNDNPNLKLQGKSFYVLLYSVVLEVAF